VPGVPGQHAIAGLLGVGGQAGLRTARGTGKTHVQWLGPAGRRLHRRRPRDVRPEHVAESGRVGHKPPKKTA
jgi:hypothetical protein